MNNLNDIGDEEFVPFLNSLGVETYNLSFEWLLHDAEFGGVLRWLYNNLDQNNALSAREEYRYNEIEKKGNLLSPEDLESTITIIRDQYPNICLPGDQEEKEDMLLEIDMLKEQLSVLEKQEIVVKNLMKQNVQINKELQQDIAHLTSEHQLCLDDEAAAADQCTTLAREVATLTDGVVDVVAQKLQEYTSCKTDKEKAKRFLALNPLESYRQLQSLFRSHFDLYVSKHLTNRENNTVNEEFRSAVVQAKDMEERLAEATIAFIESKAELSGVQAKLSLVTNYTNVHPSQITSCLLEARSALELLKHEENIVEQEVKNLVEQFVNRRTELAVHSATAAALNLRLQVQSHLNHAVSVCQKAVALDKLLYFSLRHELRTMEEFLQFASELRQYLLSEEAAVASRIESMNKTCADQEACELKLESSNPLLHLLFTTLGKPYTNNATVLVKMYNDFVKEVKEIADSVDEGLKQKEMALIEFKKSTKPVEDLVWNGCTKQANRSDRTVASLTYNLQEQMNATDRRVKEACDKFMTIKNGDKDNQRKLWQWFLAEPSKFIDHMKKFGLL